MSTEILLVAETEYLLVDDASELLVKVEGIVTLLELYEQGPPGPAGPSSDLNYKYVQGPASATWSITHNLGKFPSVTIVDSAGEEVEGAVQHINNSSLIILFSAGFTGTAYLN